MLVIPVPFLNYILQIAVTSTSHDCNQLSLSLSPGSFQMNIFKLGCSHPVHPCKVVYQPPKYNMEFLIYFSVFLAEIMLKFDWI